jgi:hypothetical protein
MYYIASVDYLLMRRDVKRVADWEIQVIVPCHGDVIEGDGNEAWAMVYQWFLKGAPTPGLLWRIKGPFMKLMRWAFLL